MTNEKGLILFGAGYNMLCISRNEFEDVKHFTFFDGLPDNCYYKQEQHGWKFTHSRDVFIQKILTNVDVYLKVANAVTIDEIDENHLQFKLTRGRTLDYYINTTVEKALLLHKDLIKKSQVLFMEGFDPFEKGLTLADVENANFFATFRGNFGHQYTYIPEGVDGSKPRLAALKAERKALRVYRAEKIMSNKQLNIKERTDKDGKILFIQFKKNGMNVYIEARVVDDTNKYVAYPPQDLMEMCLKEIKLVRMNLYYTFFITKKDKAWEAIVRDKFTAYEVSRAEDEAGIEDADEREAEDEEMKRYMFM